MLMSWLFDLLASMLATFYEMIPSFGIAIILLTFVVMILLTPLTLKGTRSMIKMQHMQPEIKKLQNRYKHDRDRMNKELMAFYQANGINPMGGCIPLFAQMPVFLVLYNVLRGLTRRQSDIGEATGWIAGQLGSGQSLTAVSDSTSVFFPDYLSSDSQLFSDLSTKTEMIWLNFDLSRSASYFGLSAKIIPYLILMLLVFFTSWYQQRQIRGRNSNQTINPQQQLIMKVMPFFLPIISYSLDAALVLYFVISNVYRIGQQAYITRTLYGSDKEKSAVVIPEPLELSDNKDKKTISKKATSKNQKTPEKQTNLSTAAKRNRTTAGENRNDSYKNSEKKQSPKKRQRKQKEIRDVTEKGENRPPGAQKGGGRTTPSGTTSSRGSQKKKKKKRK